MTDKIALIVNEEQLNHLSMLVAADMVGLEELSVEDTELEMKYRFHLMNVHSLNKQLEAKIDAIFTQIDKMSPLEESRL